MRLLGVTTAGNPTTNHHLKLACESRGVEWVELDVRRVDSSNWMETRPLGEMVYRVATSPAAHVIEQLLVWPGVSTFYRSLSAYGEYPSMMLGGVLPMMKMGLPQPKTVFVPHRERAFLRQAVEYLGGWPIVVKVAGGYSGRRVMLVESEAALFSLMDFVQNSPDPVMLREYVPWARTARLIVLGEKVVAGIDCSPPEGDFRTNVVGRKKVAFRAPDGLQRLAVKAVRACGLEFGGVDVMFNSETEAMVAEVNFPCVFWTCQDIEGGVDVSGLMVDYLMAKAKRLGKIASK